MKNQLLFLLLMTSFYSFSQLIIDAGGEKILCQTPNPQTFSIGGSPSTSGGFPPYQYSWYLASPYTIPNSSITLHASNFLSDTTSPNPTIIDGFGILDSMVFYLKVIDGNGDSLIDSSQVFFSLFIIDTWFSNINLIQGDSVLLNQGANVGAGIAPLTYLWQPTHGLTDSTNLSFYSKPDYSVSYTVTATDAKGCSITAPQPAYNIYVNYLGFNSDITQEIDIYPNPVIDKVSIVGIGIEVINISIRDVKNKLHKTLDKNKSVFDLSELASGLYFVSIETDKKVIIRRIVIK